MGAGSDGTAITPAMRGSVCAAAQASAQLSSTAEFSAVCGATNGASASSTGAGSNAGTNGEARNSAQTGTGIGTTGGAASAVNGTMSNDATPLGSGFQLPGLPSTSTAAGGIALAGLLLCGAGAFMLVRSSRKTL
jgi:hypothetical protein